MDKFKGKYRIESARLKNHDYGGAGMYFVTINTKNREFYFGGIECDLQNVAALRPTIIGKIAQDYWAEIPKHFPFVELGEFVIMPNHVHGIIKINKQQPISTILDKDRVKFGKFAPQSNNLASIIRGFKAGVKSYATKNQIVFEWQPRYYDVIIREYQSLCFISKYIRDNPKKWLGSKS